MPNESHLPPDRPADLLPCVEQGRGDATVPRRGRADGRRGECHEGEAEAASGEDEGGQQCAQVGAVRCDAGQARERDGDEQRRGHEQ